MQTGLEADKNKFNSVFVTLDPERDDYAKITDFVNLFHSNIIGLSGSVEQIDNIAKAHADEIENSDNGNLAFQALTRLMDKIDPSYRE